MLELQKKDNQSSLVFENLKIVDEINENISYNLIIKYELNEVNVSTKCIFDTKKKSIKCPLEINSDYINIKILKNPCEQYQNWKTIIFNEFENKQLYTLEAGLIEKGKCEGKKYTFFFINSKSQYKIKKKLNFLFKWKNLKKFFLFY